MKENQVSSTALTVLQGILYTARQTKYEHLVSKDIVETSKQVLMASKEGQKRLTQLDNPLFLFMVPFLEHMLIPGISLHYALRKRFIEECTVKAIESGISQIINLGAGFDTLAWRFHKQYRDINFIETDHPATSAEKNIALLKNKDKPANFSILPLDFIKQNLMDSLKKFRNFDSKRPTLFICEGVLMYLSQSKVRQLLSDIRQLTGKGSCLIFTCLEPMNSPKNNTGKLLKLYLEFKGEALNWSIKYENLEFFLEDCGYKLEELATSETLKSRYFIKTNKLRQGEYIALAQVR